MSVADHSFFVSVGELSGDILATEAVTAFQAIERDWQPFGIVGPNLRSAGVQEIADIKELSVMGIAEVAKSLANIRMLEQQVMQTIDRRKPKFALLVDYPGLHFRFAELLRLRNIPVFQYVAPKVWAWGHSRIEKLRKDFTHIFGILPFERDFFETRNVPYTYVGSPQRDRTGKIVVQRSDFGIKEDRKIFAFLPGSRVSEVSRILPVMLQCARRIRENNPKALIIVPVALSLDLNQFFPNTHEKNPDLKFDHVCYQDIVFVRGMSLEVMKIADVALVASGTATLECALLGTPMVVIYQLNELTYYIAQKSVHLPYVSLVNLVAEKKIVSEHIQNFSVHSIADELVTLSEPTLARKSMQQEFEKLRTNLYGGAGIRCANMIHKMLDKPQPSYE